MQYSHRKMVIFCVIAAALLAVIFCRICQIRRCACAGKDRHSAIAFLPRNAVELRERITQLAEGLSTTVEDIIARAPLNNTFENCVFAIDSMSRQFANVNLVAETIVLVHPDQQMRHIAQETVTLIQQTTNKLVAQNQRLFNIFWQYYTTRPQERALNEQEKQIFMRTLHLFERNGALLPSNEHQRIQRLNEKIAHNCIQFERSIYQDTTHIILASDELTGVSAHIIDTLEQSADNRYIVPMDYSLVWSLLRQSDKSQTRKKIFLALNNIGYPRNYELLRAIIKKRSELAHLLKHNSYADYEISRQIGPSFTQVRQQLLEFIKNVRTKALASLAHMLATCKDSVQQTSTGTLAPWDLAYLANTYKRTLSIDEALLAPYLSLEHVQNVMLQLASRSFGLMFELVKIEPIWGINNLSCLAVTRKSDHILIGHIILDLLPRPGKYANACVMPLVNINQSDSLTQPTLIWLIANLPCPTKTHPSLLNFDDVRIFFHEFGHAIRELTGVGQAQKNVGKNKTIESAKKAPQFMAKLLKDPQILNQLAKHYQNGKRLPERVIQQLATIRSIDEWDIVLHQAALALLSLELFGNSYVDIDSTYARIMRYACPYIEFSSLDHAPAGFEPLVSPDVYLWPLKFAADRIYSLKHHGLFDRHIERKLETAAHNITSKLIQ